MPDDIGVCSLFRDSNKWIGRNINQIQHFFTYLDQQEKDIDRSFTYYLLEGDSADDTYDILKKYENDRLGGKVNIITHETKSRPPCSDGGEDRRAALSEVGNICLNTAIKGGHDLILWMESDLIPLHSMVRGLLEATKELDWDKTLAVAPLALIKLNEQNAFYDGYAFTGINGEKWELDGVKDFVTYPNRYRPMQSIGSAALLNGKLLREHNIDFGTGCFPQLCKSGIEKGFKIYCDATQFIMHPSQFCISGRWI